jgi:hypothetical protein
MWHTQCGIGIGIYHIDLTGVHVLQASKPVLKGYGSPAQRTNNNLDCFIKQSNIFT